MNPSSLGPSTHLEFHLNGRYRRGKYHTGQSRETNLGDFHLYTFQKTNPSTEDQEIKAILFGH